MKKKRHRSRSKLLLGLFVIFTFLALWRPYIVAAQEPVISASLNPSCKQADLCTNNSFCAEAPSPTPTPTSKPYQYYTFQSNTILEMINEYRASIGLAAFQTDPALCELAQSRGPELPSEAANGNYHAGLYARNLPYWITENMAFYPTFEQDMNFWLHSTVHKSAIEGNYTYSCGACTGNICIQLFTNFSPK